jgi:hypothetical protein
VARAEISFAEGWKVRIGGGTSAVGWNWAINLTETQLYMAIGIPSLVAVLGMITNGFLFNSLSARMSGLEARMLSFENRIAAFESSVNQRIDILIGKVSEIDTRLSILEDRSSR